MTAKLGKIRDSVIELSNITGQPAISLPIYCTQEGLPVGVQVMAAKGPEEVKDSLISELKEIQKYVADNAYEWYSTHEFEDTPQVVTLMREVVIAHFERS